ncbi:phage holin family protein [Microvirga flavescens]|uniref:phage holin family protein n=1 Tax=Microvirga flavescens TaxID=2249811 RepID=UPI000DD679B3|nr:phage holin family protein [Microvirga flavescens]
MPGDRQTIQTLLVDVVRETRGLALKEIALFRAETNSNIRLLFTGLAMIVAAAVFAVSALVLFTKALVDWLATIVNSQVIAALIVGGALAAVAIVLGFYGRHVVSTLTLAPQRSARSIKRDVELVSEKAGG